MRLCSEAEAPEAGVLVLQEAGRLLTGQELDEEARFTSTKRRS